MFTNQPLTDQQRIKSQSDQSNRSNTQSTTTSNFNFPNVKETSKQTKSPAFFNNIFGFSKPDSNQQAKTSIFNNLFTSKKDETKDEQKNLFINQKADNWPTWNSAPLLSEKDKQKETLKQSQKIPNAAVVCRSHCLYFQYYHGDDGYTYFYMKNSTEFVGYKQIFEKYQDNSKCYKNTPVIRVKTEQAKRALQQRKRNGTYEVIRSWGFKPQSFQ